ncbi:MAG: hypothetical protein M0D57_02575 [Sphingobacteriales bacterium JAD_PAG50586_3]|nr:MAG: hypothetical protein M0D57_02575 [Sphingobacteriales bacterium JAD_PAG50586_3]
MLRLIFLTTLLAAANLLSAQSKIRLIGFDASLENEWYRQNDFTPAQIDNAAPTDFVYHDNVGRPYHLMIGKDVAPGNQIVFPYMRKDKGEGKKISLTAHFQLKNKEGKYNSHHIFSIGLSNQKRTLLNGQFMRTERTGIKDTLYNAFVYNSDTSDVISDTTRIWLSQTQIDVSQILFNINYQYKIYPLERASISFGAGIEAGVGYKGHFLGKNKSFDRIDYFPDLMGTIYAGQYYSEINAKTSRNQFAGSISVRPYINAAISWRLSKKAPVLKNINAFVQGRLGWDSTKLKTTAAAYNNLFVSTTFGISYIFDKYYKA